MAKRARVVWLTRGVIAIGLASFFSDLGHEMTTALLPAFLVGTLGAPAVVLGLIEGVADGVSAVFKFAGGSASDAAAGTEQGRRALGAAGYLTTSVCTALIGLARTWPVVLVLRALAWSGRGFRGPIRNALLADQVAPATYGRAFGFERALDSVGAIAAPLVASALLVALSIRPTLMLAGLPGLVAAVLFLFFVREERHTTPAEGRARGLRTALGELPGPFRRFVLSAGVFGLGNFAATFFILRATTVLVGPYGAVQGAALALGLYTLYNVVYAASAYLAGEMADHVPKPLVLGVGYALFLVACLGFALVGANLVALAALFAVAGAHIGLVETAESAYAAELLPSERRGTGFGALAAVNGVGDTISSLAVGALWTAIAPQAGFIFGAAFALIALLTLTTLLPWRRC